MDEALQFGFARELASKARELTSMRRACPFTSHLGSIFGLFHYRKMKETFFSAQLIFPVVNILLIYSALSGEEKENRDFFTSVPGPAPLAPSPPWEGRVLPSPLRRWGEPSKNLTRGFPLGQSSMEALWTEDEKRDLEVRVRVT